MRCLQRSGIVTAKPNRETEKTSGCRIEEAVRNHSQPALDIPQTRVKLRTLPNSTQFGRRRFCRTSSDGHSEIELYFPVFV